jgi:NAD(P)-dependent dehydrogenase (short-subunit alcohol dehydrogenase family)
MPFTFPSPVKTYHNDTYPAINPSLPHLSTKGKGVVITGGGSGLGPAIARSFATSGASSITLLGRTEKTLLETKAALNQDFPDTKIFTTITDIAEKDSVTSAFDAIKSNIGTIDILVANAGLLSHGSPTDLDDWYRHYDVNVKGNFNVVQAFIPVAAPQATVLNVSAGMAHVYHFPNALAYHSSKLAAIKIFDYLHMEHPEFFVLNVHPGILQTRMSEGMNHITFDPRESSGSELFRMLTCVRCS